MPLISKYTIDKLKGISVFDLFGGLEGNGTNRYCKCPKCGAEGKRKSTWQGLRVWHRVESGKQGCKCNSCDFAAYGDTINIYREVFNEPDFYQACIRLGDQFAVPIEYEDDRKAENEKLKAERKPAAEQKRVKNYMKDPDAFVSRQLAASGLTYDDVKATVKAGDDEVQVSPFQRGSLDIYSGKIDTLADEMLILYFDLEGRRKTYVPATNRTKEMPYTRVRWSNGNIKYQSPSGSKSEFYFPYKIQRAYQQKIPIDTLFIQEGEKKAEKACKHGIMSIAMQGIGNIGRPDEGLSPEIQYLCQACQIKNIVFLMDADWADLSRNITDNDKVDKRPKSFAAALIKFKRFIDSLRNVSVNVEIYFAHVNENENGDKGIDDLLANTLKGREDELLPLINESMLRTDGKGEYIDFINISNYNTGKIRSIWGLDSREDFFRIHAEELRKLKSFRFGDVFYRVNDEGEFELATEYGSGKDFWIISYKKEERKIDIDIIYLKEFLKGNGYRCVAGDDGKRGFVKIDQGIIRDTDEYYIRRFVLDFVEKATKDHEIMRYFADNISTRLSVGHLCQLDMLVTTAGQTEKYNQRIFYNNAEVVVKDSGITVEKLTGPVWEENLINRNFRRIQIFEKFLPDGNGSYIIKPTRDGEQCEFLTFLLNTSWFWPKEHPLTIHEVKERNLHVANKITCLGYLLRDYKYLNETKAVISMDSTMSEVGTSKGRSGKSLIGAAIAKFIRQAEIDGRNLTNDDQYMFSEVTRQTKNIFIDDISINFDLGRFYQRLTGKLNVNIKQGARFYIPFENAPKFYITTNHAIEDIDDSAMARVAFMSFSGWYNKSFSPYTEFGHNFFDDWDDYQWALFDNLMLECIMMYMRCREKGWIAPGCGIIDPPMHDLEMRTLRQEMGELFLRWAELYFAEDGEHINCRIVRQNMTEDYLREYDLKSTRQTAQTFSKSIFAFCKYAGLHFNAHRPNKDGVRFREWIAEHPGESFIGGRDASSSKEYYTISTTDYSLTTM